MKLLIAVPTYNRPADAEATYNTMKRSIENIGDKAESVDIAIFDNSSDNPEYKALEQKIRNNGDIYIRNSTNLGLVGNLLKCIYKAEGYDYLWMVGDDDEYDVELLRLILEKLKKDTGFVFINHYATNSSGSELYLKSALPEKVPKNLMDVYRYSGTTMMLISACVYKVEALKEALNNDQIKTERLTAPFYWSFYCAQFGMETIQKKCIRNIWGESSWLIHRSEVFGTMIPLEMKQIATLKVSIGTKLFIEWALFRLHIYKRLKGFLL